MNRYILVHFNLLWLLVATPALADDYGDPIARARAMQAEADAQRNQERARIQGVANQLRSQGATQNAPLYLRMAESSNVREEKARLYSLAAKLAQEYPGSLPGQSPNALFIKAANLFRSDPTNPSASEYFRQALVADPQNADWPLLMAMHMWRSGIDSAERYLRQALSLPHASSGTHERARQLLAQVPAERARQIAQARAAAAFASKLMRNGANAKESKYDEMVRKSSWSNSREGAAARSNLHMDPQPGD